MKPPELKKTTTGGLPLAMGDFAVGNHDCGAPHQVILSWDSSPRRLLDKIAAYDFIGHMASSGLTRRPKNDAGNKLWLFCILGTGLPPKKMTATAKKRSNIWYDKGLLVQIKEEEVYNVQTNKEFTDEIDSTFDKVEPHKKFNTQWEQYIIEIWRNSRKRR